MAMAQMDQSSRIQIVGYLSSPYIAELSYWKIKVRLEMRLFLFPAVGKPVLLELF